MPQRSSIAHMALLACALSAVLAACSTGPSAPRALLNEHTGVTINAVSEPIVFARVRDDNLTHECVTLVAAEKDEAGKYTELLLLYRWTLSAHGDAHAPLPRDAGRLQIDVDGRAIELQPLSQLPIAASELKNLFPPTAGDYVSYAYRTEFATMQQIASSHDLSVHLPQETPDLAFSLWRDGRPALAELLKQLNGS